MVDVVYHRVAMDILVLDLNVYICLALTVFIVLFMKYESLLVKLMKQDDGRSLPKAEGSIIMQIIIRY